MEIEYQTLAPHLQTSPHPSPIILVIQTPPPLGFVKLHSNGESKGNLGILNYGGLYWDHQGKILFLFFGLMGHTYNNIVELKALAFNLQVAQGQLFPKVIIEGNSQVIINMIDTILHGLTLIKVSRSCNLEIDMESIGELYVIPIILYILDDQ